jgi:hypothetical protein
MNHEQDISRLHYTKSKIGDRYVKECKIKTQAFRKGICLLLLPLFVFLSNARSFLRTSEYAYRIPKKLNDGWDVSSFTDEGIDKKAIEEISREIALKHIMTMTSGLDWNERVSYNNPQNSEWQMVESEERNSSVIRR